MAVAGCVAVAVTGCASFPAPTEQLAVTKQAVTNASSAGGTQFAPAEMRAAQDKLDRAELAMTAENYEEASLLAEQAEIDAQLAAAKARAAKAQQAAAVVQEDNRVLRKEIELKNQ